MERYTVQGSHEVFFIPSVDLNPEGGICELGGESYLEDTANFYNPVFDWLNEYCKDSSNELTFNFKLTYFNTSSSRSILDILNILKDFEDNGGKLVVNWFYDKEDEEILENGKIFEGLTGLKFNYIPY